MGSRGLELGGEKWPPAFFQVKKALSNDTRPADSVQKFSKKMKKTLAGGGFLL